MEAMAGITRFCRCETGAIAAEYGLLVGFFSLAIVGAVATFGIGVKERLYDSFLAKFP